MTDERARLYETKYKKACDVITELSKIYDELRGCLDTVYESVAGQDYAPAWCQILDDLKKFQIRQMRDIDKMTIDDIEGKVIRMKDLNKVIARPYRMTEIKKIFDKLDLVEIDTYLDQGEYFLSKETDEDCRQYIFNTIAREIAEIAYIEPPEYTPEKAKHFRDTMNKHLLLALQYNEY